MNMEPQTKEISPFERKGQFENWRFHISDATGKQELLVKFNRLNSNNRFRKLIQIFAVYFFENEKGQIEKQILKQEIDLHSDQSFNQYSEDHVQFGNFLLSPEKFTGKIRYRGHTLKWDFKIAWTNPKGYHLYPQMLKAMELVRPRNSTLNSSLTLNGYTEFRGIQRKWGSAQAILGHTQGPFQFHSWAWVHCNAFQDLKGNSKSCVFEGVSFRSKLLGPLKSPQLGAFAYQYEDETYLFSSPLNLFRINSKLSMTEWQVRADRGNLSFRASIKGALDHFLGMTMEDTDGSFLYTAINLVSEMTLLVYRNGKLESHLKSNQAAFEITNREKNPYISYSV